MTSLVRPPDEFANFLTHGVGFILSIAAAGYLLSQVIEQPLALRGACIGYSVALVLVYGSSTLSHLCYDLKWRQLFRTWDQACIFLLIAATFTPFSVLYLNQGAWRWLLWCLWGLAVLGVGRVLQVRDLPRRDKALYGLMGFLPAIAIGQFWRQASPNVVLWVVVGGVSYTAGMPFLSRSASVRYAHAVWHLLVMCGSASHYWALLLALSSAVR